MRFLSDNQWCLELRELKELWCSTNLIFFCKFGWPFPAKTKDVAHYQIRKNLPNLFHVVEEPLEVIQKNVTFDFWMLTRTPYNPGLYQNFSLKLVYCYILILCLINAFRLPLAHRHLKTKISHGDALVPLLDRFTETYVTSFTSLISFVSV